MLYMSNFTLAKTGYLPGPVDPQKLIPEIQKTKKLMQQEVRVPPARAPERGDRGAAAPGKFGGPEGQRPPGSILAFRMFHILVDATACIVLSSNVALPIPLGYHPQRSSELGGRFCLL